MRKRLIKNINIDDRSKTFVSKEHFRDKENGEKFRKNTIKLIEI